MRVIVTGAAGHIGTAICTALSDAGMQLALVDRDASGLVNLADSLGGDTMTIEADVTDSRENQRVVSLVVENWGGVDACVAGAGIEGPVAPIETLDPDEIESVFKVNTFAVFWLAAAVVPIFKEQGRGRFVPIASGAGLAGGAFASAYHASKHAVVGLTKSLARELAGSGVAVNAVCPGFVDSPMMGRIAAAEAAIRGEAPDYTAAVPAGRMAEPSEIASAVRYLVADAPDYLNGTCMVLDGALRA